LNMQYQRVHEVIICIRKNQILTLKMGAEKIIEFYVCHLKMYKVVNRR